MLFVDLGCYRGYYEDYYGDYCGGYCGDCCGDYCGGSCRGYRWVRILFANLACYAGYLGVVGVRGDVSALK